MISMVYIVFHPPTPDLLLSVRQFDHSLLRPSRTVGSGKPETLELILLPSSRHNTQKRTSSHPKFASLASLDESQTLPISHLPLKDQLEITTPFQIAART